MLYSKPYHLDDLIRYNSSYASFSYSKLNYIISKSEAYSFQQENLEKERKEYKTALTYSASYSQKENVAVTYYFTPKIFLKPTRLFTPIINAAQEIHELIEKTFNLMFGKSLPENISIKICSEEELRQMHSKFGLWNNNIQGFALNGKHKKIFVKSNNLDALMSVIGHEIGHVYTHCLSNAHDEEAKAFSFSFEWMRIIKEHNIGNIAENIKDNFDFSPAKNGLHDIAFLFVKSLINNGLKPMGVHWDLVKGYTSIFTF
ncbi:hypothetical protein HYX01_03380 [Candidatus Woesearchaeota archaeon]|nr:hypothetical protein [Candidatus Woesearchaeota archaeon]